MSSECQVHVPSSFQALYDAEQAQNRFFSFSLAANRYELCEDLLSSLIAIASYMVSNLGFSKDAVLVNCFTSLSKGGCLVTESEAQWLVSRLAERLD